MKALHLDFKKRMNGITRSENEGKSIVESSETSLKEVMDRNDDTTTGRKHTFLLKYMEESEILSGKCDLFSKEKADEKKVLKRV